MTNTLDPDSWDELRMQGHRMLDDMFDYLESLRERQVWQPVPPEVRARFHEKLPRAPQPLDAVYAEFTRSILPYGSGNVHPGFMGWVQGGGTGVGMLAEMLAAGMNANLSGRDHMPIEVERQITRWVREMLGFPEEASGLFVTGASMANLIGVLVARTGAMGEEARKSGINKNLRAYASAAAHSCVTKAMEISGLGREALRSIPFDADQRMDLAALRTAITNDRRDGLQPFLVVGTAGTVDTGAIDDLSALSEICRGGKLHFHVDGAYGALAALSKELAPRLAGIESADSVALDFHKWGQVPYDAGFVIVRDGSKHRDAFASPAAYLRHEMRGLAAGTEWPCDYGIDQSRGFRALKTWFTLKTYGADKIGAVIDHTCALARYLEKRILAEERLELLAAAQLNIVCFRYRAAEADKVNTEIVIRLQESGIAAPSTTIINGQLAIRAAIFNHRTQKSDVDALLGEILRFGEKQ